MSDIKHEGFFAERLRQDNPRELAFAEQWKQENELFQILQHLLVSENGLPFADSVCSKVERMAEYDQLSANIAATVVQWLGSNVGMDFLRCALERCGYKLVRP